MSIRAELINDYAVLAFLKSMRPDAAGLGGLKPRRGNLDHPPQANRGRFHNIGDAREFPKGNPGAR